MRVFFTPYTLPDSTIAGPVAFWTESDEPQTLDGLDSVLHYGEISGEDYVDDGVVTSTRPAGLPSDLDEEKRDAKDRLATVRWEHEIGGYLGTLSNGVSNTMADGQYMWDTSRESRSMGAEVQSYLANAPSGTTVQWKMKDGSFEAMDLGAAMFMNLATYDHVRWCFEAEGNVASQIDASSDPLAMDIPALYDAAYQAAKTP